MECIFCNFKTNGATVLFENGLAACISTNDPVLLHSCIIIPLAHKATPFDLSAKEWAAVKELLDQAKRYLDTLCGPDGYNLGWNVGETAGQVVSHAHLHVIPRFRDEPHAGKGIRHWIKQEENRRPGY